jgi:protein translocase SEC61 complex gamma subunit
MGVGEFLRDSRRILRLATKPTRGEIWSSTKISLLAMVLVGLLSFIVQVLMTTLTSGWAGQ